MSFNINYVHLLKKILESNISNRINLYKLNLMVTYRCNFRCKTCFIWEKSSANELSIFEYEKIFSRLNVNWIDVSGGEIFLRPDIKKVFSLIIKSQTKLALLHFPTNGFFTDKILDGVNYILTNSKAKLVVTISLDGPQETHNFIKGVNSWRKSIDTYKKLKTIKSKQFTVFFGYTINSFNLSKIAETIKELKREILNVDYSDIHINVEHISKHYYANSYLKFDDEMIKNCVNSYMSKRRYKLYNPIDYLEYKYHTYIKRQVGKNRPPVKCRSLINCAFICPQGNIFPCSIYSRSLGNLKDNDYNLYKILNSRQAEILRQAIKKNICPQCWTPCEAYQIILANLFKP